MITPFKKPNGSTFKTTGMIVVFTFQSLYIFHPFFLFAQKTSVIDSLENVLKNAKEDTSKVNALIALAKEFRSNNPDTSIYFANQAQSLAIKLNYELGMADAYFSVGVTFMNLDKHEQAVNNYRDALNLYDRLLTKDSKPVKAKEKSEILTKEAKIYTNIGIIYEEQGNYPEAIVNISAALKISEEIGDKKLNGINHNTLGIVYHLQGNYSEALKNHLASLKIQEEIGYKKGITIALNNIGTIYEEQGNYSEALKNYFASLKIKEEIGDNKGTAAVYTNIAVVFWDQRNYPKALESFFTALKLSEEFDNKDVLLKTLINIGGVYLSQKNFTEALKYHLASLKLAEEIGDKHSLSIASVGTGITYMNLKNDKEAFNYLNKSLLLAKETGSFLEFNDVYRALVDLDSAQGNLEQALKHYKLYIQYKDSLFNEKSNKQVSQMKIQFETEKKDKEIDLLNKENSIKALQMEQQKVSLLASKFELENNRNEILLLNKSNELQQLQLAKTQEDRDHQLLVVKAQTAGMELIKKEKELQVQQLKEQKLLRNGILAGIVLLLLLGLFLFRSLHLRKKLEKQKAIIQERKRISADLHDDIGSGLSKISLLSEMVKQQARSTEARIEAEKIAKIARELLDSIREIIWALNANNDYLENLVAFIRKNAAEYFENSSIKLRIETPVKIPQKSISGEYRRNVFYSVKEAMHNIVKHSGATEAEVKFTIEDGVFSISIKDNGKGFPEGGLNRFANGIKNIMSRMETIHGNVTIENHVGTKITLALPV